VHHAEIALASEPGQGTRVSVRFATAGVGAGLTSLNRVSGAP
jgi:signal transduction histidine kinase